MGIENYMRQDNNGSVQVLCSNLPDKGFIDATKVKDICKIKFLNRAEKSQLEPGSPDVKLIEATGNTKLIKRSDLVKNYVHTNGNRIKVAFLKNDRQYIVYNICNQPYKVLKLPDNCIGNLNGKPVNPGSYVVIPVEDGQPNRNKIGIVSPKMFRKMFRIPMQAVIKRHIGSGNKSFLVFDKFNNDKLRLPVRLNNTLNNTGQSSRINSAELGLNPANIKIPTASDKMNGSRNIDNINNTKPDNSKYRFTVVNRITDMEGKLLGFTVRELSTNNTKQVTIADVKMLCEQKLIDNVMLVTKERTGTKFLKGNGIVLNNLPSVIA